MILHTDDQTIEDLRIFGKRDSKGIYDLFNQTRTRGGETILKEMFRNPLSDRTAINTRSSIIAHFAKNNISFPFNAALFDMAEKYIANADVQTKNATRNAALSEKDINNGVSAVIALVQQISAFVSDPAVQQIKAYEGERAVIRELLNDAALEPVHQEKNGSKLSFAAVTAYDLLFRTRERGRIEKLMQQVYRLDVYLAVAAVATAQQFIFPVAVAKGGDMLLLEGVYHPGVKNAIGNNVRLHPGEHVIFLTGANMAGKSTFLRSLSTAVYLAHMGFPVAAKRMEFVVLDGIFTTINLPDNLGMGASHFYAEVLRVKKIAAELHAGKSLLVIFDELFRGTNVKDAHEATVAITGAFTAKKDSLFVISSHIVEAGDDLKKFPGTGFLYLPTRMKGHTPEYTYTLERGITDDRHGMIIIRNEGILDILKNGRKRALEQ
ncbi:DNA mismatch repair protein [Chitinophaga sp. Cy-1792]|uniref:MutS-related protein n=1 Tax=Chitinophaga sp. Cy-1792 TaxID=2608339 RepID=UPI00141F485E|nr:DNA mismatch repair protein [Chitinophaga sp. Cy-1792]NIG55429.1 DNA mismatch repair protein [Chitinophaga sp. Cy-1792]